MRLRLIIIVNVSLLLSSTLSSVESRQTALATSGCRRASGHCTRTKLQYTTMTSRHSIPPLFGYCDSKYRCDYDSLIIIVSVCLLLVWSRDKQPSRHLVSGERQRQLYVISAAGVSGASCDAKGLHRGSLATHCQSVHGMERETHRYTDVI